MDKIFAVPFELGFEPYAKCLRIIILPFNFIHLAFSVPPSLGKLDLEAGILVS